MFTTGADRINAFRVNRQGGFQSNIANPVGVIVIDVSKSLALAKLQLTQHGVSDIGSASAVVFPINMEIVKVLIIPFKEDLNDGVKLSYSIQEKDGS